MKAKLTGEPNGVGGIRWDENTGVRTPPYVKASCLPLEPLTAAPLCPGTYALGLRAADRDQTGTQSLKSPSYSLASTTVHERGGLGCLLFV